MTKIEMIEAVAKATGRPKTQVREILEAIQDRIVWSVQGGSEVVLAGFGTFKPVVREQRQGRNPATGEQITIAARRSVKFKPAKAVDAAVNG